jgi:TonB family protein
MTGMLEMMRTIPYWLGWNSLYAAVAFCGVALLLYAWKRAPAAVAHVCWWLVFVRLLLPVDLGLPFSIGSLMPEREGVSGPVVLVGYSSGTEALSGGDGQPAVAGQSRMGLPVVLSSTWAMGALMVLSWLAWRRRRFTVLLRSARAVDDRVVLDILSACIGELGLRRSVRLVHGEGTVSPFTVGVLRPVIWIPTSILERFDPALLRCLIAHELVHVARLDDLFIRLQLVLHSLFFFHPLVWFAGSRIDRSREQACDEQVVAGMNIPFRDYGRSLVETLRFNLLTISPLANFGGGRKRSLEMRLRSLSTISRKSRLTLIVPVIVAWLLLPLAGSAHSSESALPSEPPTAATESEESAGEIIRVGGDVKPPRVVKRVDPQYPKEARENRVTGVVILEAVIDKEGRVEQVRALKGIPFGLTEAAMDAVRQWEFEPALKDGVPVTVFFNLTVNFRLKSPPLTNPLPEGRLTSRFGERLGLDGETIEIHSGTDLAAPRGTAVLAAGDGEVLVATTYDPDRTEAGTFVVIDHGSDIKTFYSHLDSLAV